MHRKLLTYIFLCVVLFQSLGILLSYSFLLTLAEDDAKAILRGKYRPAVLVELTFPKNAALTQFRTGNCRINGTSYFVKSVEHSGDLVKVKCWTDVESSRLYDCVDMHTNNSIESNSENGSISVLSTILNLQEEEYFAFPSMELLDFSYNNEKIIPDGFSGKIRKASLMRLVKPPQSTIQQLI